MMTRKSIHKSVSTNVFLKLFTLTKCGIYGIQSEQSMFTKYFPSAFSQLS